MKNKIQIMIAMIVVALVAVTQTIIAGDAYWTAGVSGNWEDAGNWDVVPVANDSIFINGDGTYTSVWNSDSLSTTFSNITVGVSASGVQTLQITGPAYQSLNLIGGIVVGPNGIFEQNNSLTDTTSGSYATIQVMDGGVWRVTNTDSRAAFIGSRRAFQVDAGGVVDILEGVICKTRSDISTNIINGEITGDGTFVVAGGGTTRIAGTGVVDVAKITLPYNGSFFFYGGGIVVNSEVYPSSGNLTFNGPGQMTFNGDILYTNSPDSILLGSSTSERTIAGEGDIIAWIGNNIEVLGRSYDYESPGKLYLTGTGNLLMNMNGYTGTCYGSLDLGRDAVISNGVFFLNQSKGICINVTNEAGNVLFRDMSLVIPGGNSKWDAPPSVKASDSGTITFDNVDITATTHKEKFSLMNIEVSGGNLNFASGSENSIKLDTDSGSSDYGTNYWQARLNSGSEVTAAMDASLLLENGRFLSEISQGWQFEGTLIIGTNMTMTALSQDNGSGFNPKEEPNYTGTLKILEEADVFTLNEFVTGGAENQTCLYVGTLDFSDISGGSEPVLTGCDGDAKVYYLNLINPNGVTFDNTKWVQGFESLAGTVIIVQ